MQLGDETLDVVVATEVPVQGVEVACPIASMALVDEADTSPMVHSPVVWIPFDRSIYVRRDGRDPDSIKTHILDVIETIYDATPVTTAIFPFSGITWRVCTISYSEPIRYDL